MKMRLFFFGIFLISGFLINAQYVTLEGRRFKLGNDFFYPVVCCYNVQWLTDGTPTGLFISPMVDFDGWGSYQGFECNNEPDCLDQIQRHFKQIKHMGFNTIRLYGAGPRYSYCLINKSVPHGFIIEAENISDTGKIIYSFTNPFENSFSSKVFACYAEVMYRAYLEGLKVIFDVELWEDNILLTQDFDSDYPVYLDALTKYFMNYNNHQEFRQALFAYCDLEEPLMSNFSAWPNPDLIVGHTKQDICEKVTQWYNVIKNNDPNHLITIGGNDFLDIFEWDPAVLKLDFYSIHAYSKKMPYEVANPSGDPVGQMINRINGHIYWTANNCPMPFIVGETGFRSQVGTSGPDGTPMEQRLYAEETLQKTLDCDGSGYTWWNYQDYIWPNNPDEKYWGLLEYNGNCNPVPCDTLRKPVVDAFLTFEPNGLVNPDTPPNSYMDPYNHELYAATNNLSSSILNTVHGKVLDENNDPIINAVILGYTILHPDPLVSNSYIYDIHYTFTDSLGEFVLIPYDYDSIASPNTIENMQISAVGAERLERGWNNSDSITVGIPGEIFHLKHESFNNNFSNIILHNQEYRSLHSIEILTASNIIYEPGSGGDISALKEVILLSESCFEGENHLYNSEYIPNCEYFSSFNKAVDVGVSKSDNRNINDIELNFLLSDSNLDFTIAPNPNDGMFFISINDHFEKEPNCQIEIFDLLCNLVFKTQGKLKDNKINISGVSSGVYTIKLTTINERKSKLFIIK
jgi:hypothetical protein